MQIIYFVPTYSVPFEIKVKLWNALKSDYHGPAVSVSWLVSQYRLQITTILYLTLIGRLFWELCQCNERVVLRRPYPL